MITIPLPRKSKIHFGLQMLQATKMLPNYQGKGDFSRYMQEHFNAIASGSRDRGFRGTVLETVQYNVVSEILGGTDRLTINVSVPTQEGSADIDLFIDPVVGIMNKTSLRERGKEIKQDAGSLKRESSRISAYKKLELFAVVVGDCDWAASRCIQDVRNREEEYSNCGITIMSIYDDDRMTALEDRLYA